MSPASKQVTNVARNGNVRPPNAGKGRPKGTPNKTTASIKAALSEAFEKLGGVRSLVAWGTDNPSDFYKLWGRMAPQEMAVTGQDGSALVIRVVRETAK